MFGWDMQKFNYGLGVLSVLYKWLKLTSSMRVCWRAIANNGLWCVLQSFASQSIFILMMAKIYLFSSRIDEVQFTGAHTLGAIISFSVLIYVFWQREQTDDPCIPNRFSSFAMMNKTTVRLSNQKPLLFFFSIAFFFFATEKTKYKKRMNPASFGKPSPKKQL